MPTKIWKYSGNHTPERSVGSYRVPVGTQFLSVDPTTGAIYCAVIDEPFKDFVMMDVMVVPTGVELCHSERPFRYGGLWIDGIFRWHVWVRIP